jgi:hypothetical protein
MGTSASSKGPGGDVPLVPPWVPPVDLPPETDNQSDETEEVPSTERSVLAPLARFKYARMNFGQYAHTGSRNDLKAGLGHDTRTGLGGARHATRRMGGTAKTAGALRGVFDALRSGATPPVDLGIDPSALSGRPAQEIRDRIVDAIRPTDGTQDTEASRDSIAHAISDLLEQDPSIDLTALTPKQIDFIVEYYVAYDLCRRIELDIGQAIRDKVRDAATWVHRLEEIRQYVCQKVAACFRSRTNTGGRFTRQNATTMVALVIKDVFTVFEEYLK